MTPLRPHTSYVRALLTESSFTASRQPRRHDPRRRREVHCDPMGSVPGWMVNLFQRNWGVNTIKSLRKQVAKGEAPANPLLRQVLAGSG